MSATLTLHDGLQAQKIHWKQSSRIPWLNEGNKNTKFFHQSAKVRSSFNSINHISVDGNHTDDLLTIKSQAMDFFSKLFKPHDGHRYPILFQTDRPKVSDSKNSFLVSIPSDIEIKDAVFALKKNRSPNPNGFSGTFYTSAWGIIGQAVI
ncbi:hypothetical protein AAC387_Pa04g1678 [Persea americana]